MKHRWLWTCLCSSACLWASMGLPAQAAAPTSQDALRTEAVQLARNSQYDKALTIFKQLETQGDYSINFWADYLTVLAWAGKNQEVVDLSTAQFGTTLDPLPDYTLLAIARAYSNLGELSQSDRVYALLDKRGNKTASQLYAAQLELEQALDAMGRKNYVEAEAHFSRAKQEAPATEKNFARDVDARRAALYVKNGEPGRAIHILQPYAEKKQITPHMFSDYLLALRLEKQQKKAIQAYRAYPGDPEAELPAYGLQTMGDIYLREQEFRKAHTLYLSALKKNNLLYARLSDAYALARLGKKKEALAQYRQVLEESSYSPKIENLVASDGATYLHTGDLHLARQVFGLLGKTPAEKEQYQLQYGLELVHANGDLYDPVLNFQRDQALDGRDYHKEARKVLNPLGASADSEISLAARSALTQNELDQGRFATADKRVKALIDEDNDAAPVLSVSAKNDARRERNLSVWATSSMDNKRNHETDLGLEASGYVGGNLTATVGDGHSTLQDGTLNASYSHQYTGLTGQFAWGSAGLFYDHYTNGLKDGWHGALGYDLSDVSSLAVSAGRRPHDAAGAVRHHITENYRTLSWNVLPAPRWSLTLSGEQADLSDDNKYWSLGLSGHYALGGRHNYFDTLPFAIGRSHYDHRSDVYDSPDRSLYYSAGWSRHWLQKNQDRTWAWTNMLGGGHDNDERNGFSPSTRVEMVQNLPAHQKLRLAAQYNWYFHQDPNAAWNRRNNGYQFELGYEIGW